LALDSGYSAGQIDFVLDLVSHPSSFSLSHISFFPLDHPAVSPVIKESPPLTLYFDGGYHSQIMKHSRCTNVM
jgi:hypothetical protein